MILIYPIGVPVLYFYLLYHNKDEIMHRDDELEQGSRWSSSTAGHSIVSESGNDSIVNPMRIDGKDEESQRPSVSGDGDSRMSFVTRKNKYVSENMAMISFLWGAYQPRFW